MTSWIDAAMNPSTLEEYADWLNKWGDLIEEHQAHGESREWQEGYRQAIRDARRRWDELGTPGVQQWRVRFRRSDGTKAGFVHDFSPWKLSKEAAAAWAKQKGLASWRYEARLVSPGDANTSSQRGEA